MKAIRAVLLVFITLPIWLYLQYQILDRVQASELMWFLFWVYAPVALIASVLGHLMEDK